MPEIEAEVAAGTFARGALRITRTQIQLGNTTIALHNVSSAETSVRKDDRGPHPAWKYSLVCGAVAVIVGCIFREVSRDGGPKGANTIGWMLIIGGILAAIWGVFVLMNAPKSPPTYELRIITNAQEPYQIQFSRAQDAADSLRAIRAAISYR